MKKRSRNPSTHEESNEKTKHTHDNIMNSNVSLDQSITKNSCYQGELINSKAETMKLGKNDLSNSLDNYISEKMKYEQPIQHSLITLDSA